MGLPQVGLPQVCDAQLLTSRAPLRSPKASHLKRGHPEWSHPKWGHSNWSPEVGSTQVGSHKFVERVTVAASEYSVLVSEQKLKHFVSDINKLGARMCVLKKGEIYLARISERISTDPY